MLKVQQRENIKFEIRYIHFEGLILRIAIKR